MAGADTLAAAHYRQRVLLAGAAASAAQRSWRQIDPAYISESWTQLVIGLLRALTGYQRAAAAMSDRYVASVLEGAQAGSAAVARVSPSAFAGVASDGRDLGSLLTTPLIDVFGDLSDGMTADTALIRGMNRLVPIVATQVQDAGRLADQAAMTAQPEIDGYIRRVNLPSCARCIILAGRVYRYSTGFKRHPKCDCTMVPDVGTAAPQDPAKLIAQMQASDPGTLAKSLTAGDLQAIEHGADINQVINAHRSMTTAAGPGRDIQVTTEGTTRRGLAGKRLGAAGYQRAPGARYGRARVPRLTPAQIFDEAARGDWSREEILRQLRRFGYVI
jgi:hypothetical protein